MTHSYNDLLRENAELKKRIHYLEETALRRSVEFERFRKMADGAVKELEKIMEMVGVKHPY